MFPPVSSYRRFLIHKTCEQLRAEHEELTTFSIGQGPFRRTVVCLERCLLNADGARAEGDATKNGTDRYRNSWRSGNHFDASAAASNGNAKSTPRSNGGKMGVEHECIAAVDPAVTVNRTPHIQLYKPPGARRSLSLAEESAGSSKPSNGCESSVTKSAPLHQPRTYRNGEANTIGAGSECLDSVSLSIEHQVPLSRAVDAQQRQSVANGSESIISVPSSVADGGRNSIDNTFLHSDSTESTNQDPHESTNFNNNNNTIRTPISSRPRRPDRAVYVPRARRSQTTPPASTTTTPSSQANHSTPSSEHIAAHYHSPSSNFCLTDNSPTSSRSSPSSPAACKPSLPSSARALVFSDSTEIHTITPTTASDLIETNGVIEINAANCDTFNRNQPILDFDGGTPRQRIMHRNNELNKETTAAVGEVGLRIEDAQFSAKDDKDEKELQRASKEINRSNRRLMKQTFASNVLEISDPIPKATRKPTRPAEPLAQSPPKPAIVEPSVESSAIKAPQVDPETDDWESIFDENGDCLDPKLIEEITASVGKVTIETPKSDYKLFHSKQALLNAEEFPHVLEVSGFPVEFKTPDLMMLFSPYKGTGFDIKWVDDTHALAVFSSSKIAAEVLSTNHPFVVLKTLTEATVESRSRAKKCGTSLQPYRQRPETCAALARRLVTGALGVRLKTSTEERENERRVLREAKERKLLAAKQRDEAWES